MATPRKPNSPRTPQSQRNAPVPQSTAPQLVDPRWILKALGLVFAVALLLAWGTLCLLWYQGQWQLVLHPSHDVLKTPTFESQLDDASCTETRFFTDETGNPRLNARLCPVWVTPLASTPLVRGFNPNYPAVLYLHGADGSINDALPRASALRYGAKLNVLLFDYRGYGKSAGQHPTQATMQEDAEAALNFMLISQHIPPQKIILYGQGLGASLAVQLAAEHHDIPAIILDAPDGDLTNRVVHDPHSSLVPARLLFNEPFPLAEPLSKLTTPKLLITYTNAQNPPPALASAANPKTTIELPSPTDPTLLPAIQRFVDLYIAH